MSYKEDIFFWRKVIFTSVIIAVLIGIIIMPIEAYLVEKEVDIVLIRMHTLERDFFRDNGYYSRSILEDSTLKAMMRNTYCDYFLIINEDSTSFSAHTMYEDVIGDDESRIYQYSINQDSKEVDKEEPYLVKTIRR